MYVVEAIEDLCTSAKTVLDAISNDTSWGGGRKKEAPEKKTKQNCFDDCVFLDRRGERGKKKNDENNASGREGKSSKRNNVHHANEQRDEFHT